MFFKIPRVVIQTMYMDVASAAQFLTGDGSSQTPIWSTFLDGHDSSADEVSYLVPDDVLHGRKPPSDWRKVSIHYPSKWKRFKTRTKYALVIF